MSIKRSLIKLMITAFFIVNIAVAITYAAPTTTPTIWFTSATESTITVSWSKVNKVDSYDIEADGVVTNTANSTIRNYTDTGRNSGTVHNYRVRGRDSTGAGPWSTMLQAYTLPGVPAAITPTVTVNSIALNWSYVPGSTGYDVERDGTIVNNGASTYFSHTGLTPGSQHNYRVRAKNTSGTGAWSDLITVFTQPTAPTGVTATASSTAITLAWTATAGATGYDVEADGTVLNNGNAIKYTHMGLLPNSYHNYRVRAKNSSGAGAWSNTVTKATAAAAPTIAGMTATSTTVKVTWTAVTGATGYDLEWDGTVQNVGTGTTYTVTGLTPNTQYSGRLRVRNANGNSDWSEMTTLYTMTAVPGGITFTSSSSTITMRWSAVAGATGYDVDADGVVTDNGAAITFTDSGLNPSSQHNYRVRAKNANGAGDWSGLNSAGTLPDSVFPNVNTSGTTTSITVSWGAVAGATGYDIEVDGAIVNNGTNTTYTQSGLTAGTKHNYRLRARNASGTGDWSAYISVYTLPGTPAGITATSGSTTITITWTATGGALGYDVEFDGAADNGASTTYTKTGLANNSVHNYRVRAKNDSGAGAWSTLTNKTTAPGVPVLSAPTVTSTSIAFSWAAVAGTTAYDVEWDGTVINNGTSRTYTRTGLVAGSQHNYRVRARSGNGNGDWTPIQSYYTIPGVPTGITTGASSTSITLTWTATQGATGYDVEADGTVVNNGANTTYTQTGLTSGSTHSYRVRAKNASGMGAWSATYSDTTAPGVPTAVDTTSTINSITITWSAVTGATAYDIERDGTILSNLAATTNTHTGLAAGSSHNYRVRAKNANGPGDWTAIKTAYTLPAVPAGVTASSTVSSVTISWAAVTGATGYDVERDGTVISNGTDLTFLHSGLDAGSQHKYRVRATNAGGGGAWSNLLTVSTLSGIADIPVLSTAYVTQVESAQSWTMVDGAESYDLEVDGFVVQGFTYNLFIDEGLDPATTYVYRIRSRNKYGVSEWSSPNNITTPAGVLGIPGAPKVASKTKTSAKLAWNAVAGATGYTVEVDDTAISVGSATSYNLSGLSAGSAHYFRVKATGSGVVGKWSNFIDFTTLP